MRNVIEPNENYHDRIAHRYDEIYKSKRWELYFEISWGGMKQHIFLHIPKTAGSSVRTLIQQNYPTGLTMGFSHVQSSPLTRSSYHAWEQVVAVKGGDHPEHGEGSPDRIEGPFARSAG